MIKSIIWKKRIIIFYLIYISLYYIISRFIFLYLGILKNFDVSFWAMEVIFPFLYTTINIITIIFIKVYIDKVNNLIKNEKLKDIFFDLFPNKYIFIIITLIGILLNIEGLIIKRFNLLQYHELIGNNSILLNQIEIWQNCFILPIIFSVFTTIIQTTLKLKKNQQNYLIKQKIINEFQRISLSGFQIYLLFVIIYFILIIFKVTSENLPLSIIIIIGYCSSILITIHIFKQSLMSFRSYDYTIFDDNIERRELILEIQEICKNFQKTDRKMENWENFLQILVNNVKFSDFFDNLFKKSSKFEKFKRYFEVNKSKNKILILFYIVASKIIKKEDCITNYIINDLKISKSTTHRNIYNLEKEGLIIRETIASSKDKNLIPNFN